MQFKMLQLISLNLVYLPRVDLLVYSSSYSRHNLTNPRAFTQNSTLGQQQMVTCRRDGFWVGFLLLVGWLGFLLGFFYYYYFGHRNSYFIVLKAQNLQTPFSTQPVESSLCMQVRCLTAYQEYLKIYFYYKKDDYSFCTYYLIEMYLEKMMWGKILSIYWPYNFTKYSTLKSIDSVLFPWTICAAAMKEASSH